MNEKDLQRACESFIKDKRERKRLSTRVARLLSKTNVNEKELKRALRVFYKKQK
jgi:hypothetical protein